MSTRVRLAALATVVWLVPLTVAPAANPGEPLPAYTPSLEIENSRFQFEGEVNATAVFVRSGPSDNDYATMKLDKGARVTVVGLKFDWLKILPPQGSFCYVAKAYVEKRGDGSLGRVTNALNVRVGSDLVPKKTKVAARLEPGQTVQIIGEQDEYFKIKPPKDVYLYINKQFVDPVRRVEIPELAQPGPAGPRPAQPTGIAPEPGVITAEHGASVRAGAQFDPPRPPVGDAPGQMPPIISPAKPEQSNPIIPPADASHAPDQPSNTAVAIPENPVPAADKPTIGGTPAGQPGATEPTIPAEVRATPAAPTAASSDPAASALPADVEFERLEEQMKQVASKPIELQPVPEMLAAYEKLAARPELPESMRRIAEYRIEALKVHDENRQLILAHRRDQDSRHKELLALRQEGNELLDRVKSSGIQYYTAVGTLRPSSLQIGDGTLYRLTDPLTGRTVVYIKSDDPKLVNMLGLFVGVQGQIVDDAQWKLKWISPTDCQPIEKDKINQSIAAKLIPPSLMPGGALAGTRADD